MKVAIEVLSTNFEPAVSNIAGMKKTFVYLANDLKDRGLLKHSYDFYFYRGGYSASTMGTAVNIEKDNSYRNCYNVNVSTKETIYDTFEKGIWALKYTPGYDWYLRINISCYLNIQLLDKVLDSLNEDTVYCNALNSYINDERYFNHLYPRGDMMIFSAKTRNGILKHSDDYFRCDLADKDRLNIPHVDDCMFGLCLIKYFGDKYFEHLQMLKYNYIPDASNKIDRDLPNCEYCIGSRVKTTPPGITYSGYSWEDNEYRRFDIKKMEYLNNKLKDFKYPDNIDISNLYSNSRPTIFVSLSNQTIDVFHKYLNKIRGTK